MAQPLLRVPTRLAAGTTTSVRNTSLRSGCSGDTMSPRGRTTTPGVFMSTRITLMPLCFGARRIGTAEQEAEVGVVGPRGPQLLAVDDEPISVEHGGRREGSEVAAGPWLAHSQASGALALEQRHVRTPESAPRCRSRRGKERRCRDPEGSWCGALLPWPALPGTPAARSELRCGRPAPEASQGRAIRRRTCAGSSPAPTAGHGRRTAPDRPPSPPPRVGSRAARSGTPGERPRRPGRTGASRGLLVADVQTEHLGHRGPLRQCRAE